MKTIKKRTLFIALPVSLTLILAVAVVVMRPENQALESRLVDRKQEVRDAATSELKYLSDSSKEELVPLLTAILRERRTEAAYAAEALGRLGKAATAAIPDLVE